MSHFTVKAARAALVLSASASSLMFALSAHAAAGTGAEGSDADAIIVTAERTKAAAAAPTKASILETQPQSIISHNFIEDTTPETGNYSTVVLIAPSVGGIAANGGGVGETNKSSLRGFQDGQYNITYDGISFGDTNNPTHHTASYFPTPTIGSAVVDRGPGAAGDLGQANYGGAIHFFSPKVSDSFSFTQKATFGSFETQDYDSTLQTGTLKETGAKVWINFNEHSSAGELTNSGGSAEAQSIKIYQPLGDKLNLTLFSSHLYTKFFQADAGPGATWQQITSQGRDFGLNDTPGNELYKNWNFEKKQTDFEYADLKADLGGGLTWEDQAYTYFYSNKTTATSGITDTVGANGLPVSDSASAISKNGAKIAGNSASDVEGYLKGNRYRVYGDIVRVNKDWGFGTLKLGGLIEYSDTDRHNYLQDFTTGTWDPKYGPSNLSAPYLTNAKTSETSTWTQYQVFADFEWRPLENLTLTPGFKYVDFTRNISAAIDAVTGETYGREPVNGSAEYKQPLYFFTGNYRILPEWSVYAQYGQSFLIPQLSDLQVPVASDNSSKPAFAESSQLGTVYTKGHITADFDVYSIDISNLDVPSTTVIDGNPAGSVYVNAGNVQYRGAEGELAYTFDFGLTVFANGSVNSAKTLATTPASSATSAQPSGELYNAPKWTDALGLIYKAGPWHSALTFKEVGAQVAYVASATGVAADGVALVAGDQRELKAYSVLNGDVAYDFGRFRVKLAGFNLANHRSITSISGGGSLTDLYEFQAGREVQVTLSAKF